MNDDIDNKTDNKKESRLGPVIYARHLETGYNIYRRLVTKQFLECKPEFTDVGLCENAKHDIEHILKLFKNLKIKYVFCCPMLRCLETCEIFFKNHPDKDKITVFVNPWLMGSVTSNDDFSADIANKQKMFNENSSIKFDWSHFNKLYPNEEDRELYYFNFMDQISNDKEAKIIFHKIKNIEKAIIKDIENNNYSDYEILLTKFAEIFHKKKKKPESLKNLHKRCILFKDYIKSFLPKLSDDEKIIIITHCSYIKISSSKMAESMDEILKYPPDCKYIFNAQIMSMDLD